MAGAEVAASIFSNLFRLFAYVFLRVVSPNPIVAMGYNQRRMLDTCTTTQVSPARNILGICSLLLPFTCRYADCAA